LRTATDRYRKSSVDCTAAVTSRLLISALVLTQLCDPFSTLAAKKNPPAARTVMVKLPPQSLVDRLSTVFLASNGNTGEVMRFLVQSPEFWSVASYRAKIKTPEDFVISATRSGDVDVQDANVVVKAISDLGQPLYGRQIPDGYSMLSAPWVNSSSFAGANELLPRVGEQSAEQRSHCGLVDPAWRCAVASR
jgi:hypothetical protein